MLSLRAMAFSERQTMDGDARLGPERAGWGSLRTRFTQLFVRTWRTPGGRRAMAWGTIVVIALLVIGTGVLVFSSLSSDTPSYKSGFSSGAAVYAADGRGATPEEACQAAAARPAATGGVPVDGNPTDWVRGCVVAFEDAQNGN